MNLHFQIVVLNHCVRKSRESYLFTTSSYHLGRNWGTNQNYVKVGLETKHDFELDICA